MKICHVCRYPDNQHDPQCSFADHYANTCPVCGGHDQHEPQCFLKGKPDVRDPPGSDNVDWAATLLLNNLETVKMMPRLPFVTVRKSRFGPTDEYYFEFFDKRIMPSRGLDLKQMELVCGVLNQFHNRLFNLEASINYEERLKKLEDFAFKPVGWIKRREDGTHDLSTYTVGADRPDDAADWVPHLR